MLRSVSYFLVLVPLGTLQAQTPLHVQRALYPGEANGFGFQSTAGMGDVDGDGVPDYAVGARREFEDPGYVVLYSGATGKVIATLAGNGGSDEFGSSVAGIGDVNSDLVPDLLVGARTDDTYGSNRGVAQVISGSDGAVLREHTGTTSFFGESVAALGDATGDGVSEYLVCEYWDAVHCFDGASGLRLWKYQGGFWDAVRLGPTTGDANGDGIPDALIGAPSVSPSGAYALVLDGLTGAEIYRLVGPASTPFGASVSWIGDLDGDGSSEFAVGNTGRWSTSGNYEVHDGASGALLYRITQTIAMGDFICGMGDQNGDGVPDFAANDWGPKLYSGVDGSLIHAYDPNPMVAPQFAVTWLAPAGDLDGDGATELLHGTYDSSPSGEVIVYSSSTHPLEDLGFALGGASGDPVLASEGLLAGGSLLRTELSNASAWASAFLVVGRSASYSPLSGGTLVPAPDYVRAFTTDGSGRHEFTVTMPLGLASPSELYMQYWIFVGGSPPTASNAVKGILR